MGFAVFLSAIGVISELSLVDVERTITLRSSTIQVISTAKIKNDGSKPVSNFTICFVETDQMKAAFVAAVNKDKKDLKVKKKETEDNIVHYRVTTPTAIEAGGVFEMTISAIFGNAFWPHPKKKTQFQAQSMKFTQTLHICSPYPVTKQTTILKRASKVLADDETSVSIIETEPKHTSDTAQALTFGPYQNVKPFSRERITALVANNNHCSYFTKIEREIEVSHWGNVAVVERFELKHGGAALEGDFNRVPFMWQGQGRATPAALKQLRAVLPRSSRQIDYRDFIGNISTSWVRKEAAGYVNVEMTPRYPIIGGWKAHWELWYNTPLKNVLQVDANDRTHFVLNVSFAHPYPGFYAEKVHTRVILPEGASTISLNAPRPVESALSYSWLWMDYSSQGRPVVEFTDSHFVLPEKMQLTTKFQVLYNFRSIYLLREPLYLSFFIFSLFLTYLIGIRSRLRILRHAQGAALDEVEHNMKICLYFIDAFDDLWNHLRNLIEQSELSAEKPVVHKWNAIFTKAKEQSKRLSDACDKIALKHTKDTLRKLMTKIKELTEIEHNHAQLRGGGERTSEGEKQIATCSSKASKLEEEVITTLRAATCDAERISNAKKKAN